MALTVPEPLVALMVTELEPAAVGVPLITPVLLLRLRPSGNPVAPKLLGELVAVMV